MKPVSRRPESSPVPVLPLALALALGLAGCADASSQGVDPSSRGADAPSHPGQHRPAVSGVRGLVTGGHPLASLAGMQMLLKGGNAADASVAVLATLNVVKPSSSGAGGNGFFTIYEKETGRVVSLNATGAAPLALKPEEMTPEALNEGVQAGIVPGLIGAWIALLDRYGTMSLAEVLEPAIGYAENGHPIEETIVRGIEARVDLFSRYPNTARTFLPNGRVPEVGELFRMPDYARTLRRVVQAEQTALRRGNSRSEALQTAFDLIYKGEIAREMAHFFGENGGLLAYEDFAAYEPIWAEPLHTTYRGYDVYTSPSTSRGGYEVTMQLNLVEGFDMPGLRSGSAESFHLLSEAIKVAKSDIYRYVADPKFATIPTSGMLSKAYADERRQLIASRSAVVYPEPGEPTRFAWAEEWTAPLAHAGPPFPEQTFDGGTDSFSVLDPSGNVIVVTPTHGGGFGNGVLVGETGFFLNNGMRLGSTSPYPDNVNYPRPGQIPILNNAPIVVLKDGEFVLSLGTPGGEQIGQTQFQVLVYVLDYGMGIQEAIEAPRVFLSADPNFYRGGAEITVGIENRLEPGVLDDLRGRGHRLELLPGFSSGNMQGILRDPKTGTYRAGADPRNLGYAIGW